MSSYRILLHIRASGGGGAERVFATLANGFVRRGHAVTLAVDELVDADKLDPRVDLVDLGRNHVKGVLKLARLIRRGRYDILAAGVAVSNVKLTLAKLLAPSTAPLVLSYHGFREYRTGKLSAAAYYGMPLLRLIAARFICVSNGLMRALIEEWHAPADRTIRIYNPVPLPAHHVNAEEVNARPPVIGAVGRLSAEKGMDVLVSALRLMRTPDVRLLIGGEGPERDKLEKLIAELGLQDRVTLAGQVDGPGAIYDKVRVAAVPSRTEAFGMTAVEALAHGLPVVASDCDGPAEILGDGRFGLVVPVDDPVSLASGLDLMLSRPHDPALGIWRAGQFSDEIGLDQWEAAFEAVIRR
ncbi:glycosyltransferase [Oryzibacter oryziterrae]|uniref:glycosyltransferase n=1 Tax=Oryzibacter oryziterrae TaxID=2766474 RepID=UPI001F47E3E4|nr:glycosyltransferase [Oryzibacter oryziterrae]